ncbi:MAG: serine/threonine-protein phosphatase [Gammaproteobacteria bacterium]|nr:serine/threonine-protein phosphatase [Gammaproteobacteria bacterium]
MRVEYADLSLIGDREENQDRVMVVAGERATLLIAIDGMGGHSDGAKAAKVAAETIRDAFRRTTQPVFDPIGFLHLVIGRAHLNLVTLGARLSLESRPRATCALCLVQDGASYFAHVGDSRIYHLRAGKVRERTRDHSHVELLLQDGVITEAEVAAHPMRNYVECCLGGDTWLPGMTITRRKPLEPGDVLLACTDGFWTGLSDERIGALATEEEPLATGLRRLGEQAVRACGPYSDNTSGVVLRYLGAGVPPATPA